MMKNLSIAMILATILLAGTAHAQWEPGSGFSGSVSSGNDYQIDMVIPSGLAAVSTTGGSLAEGTYYFEVIALDSDGGTTTASNEVSCTVSHANDTVGRCSLSWSSVLGAASYRVYKGTAVGAENKYKAASSLSLNWDSDSGSTAGSPPISNSAYVVLINNSGTSRLDGGGLEVGGGSTIAKFLFGSATLDFPNSASTGCDDLTINVTGAVDGNVCQVGAPNGSVGAESSFFCFVSSSGVVTVRHCSHANVVDPASGTFKVLITQ